MGCGMARAKKEKNEDIRVDSENASVHSNLLLRYQTNNNVYNIKLKPPKNEAKVNT